MQLDPAERKDLAVFLAKRFPGVDERAQLAARAKLDAWPGDPVESWSHLLEEAQREGAMARLGQVLVDAAPADRNLQEAVRLLSPRPRTGRLGMLVAGAIVVIGVGGWALWPSAEVDGRTEGLATVAPVAPAVVKVAAPVAPPPAPSSEAAPPVVAPAAPAADPAPVPAAPAAVTPPVAAPAPAPPAPVAAAVASPSGPPVLGCDNAGSGLVGWWYAGTAAPGVVGDVVTLPRDARVRAAYPSAENHHDARTAERCVLPRGARVRLSQAPVNPSGDHWWVPYVAGDAVGD